MHKVKFVQSQFTVKIHFPYVCMSLFTIQTKITGKHLHVRKKLSIRP